MRERGRRERQATNQRTAVEEQIELADRQRDRRVGIRTPHRGESPALEPLRIDAEPGPVEVERFGADAIAADEEKHVAVERIAMQALRDERTEPIKAFPHVGRLGVRIDGDAAPVPRHRNRRSNRAADSRSSPSMCGPSAVIRMVTVGPTADATGDGTTVTG